MKQIGGWRRYTFILQIVAGTVSGVLGSGAVGNIVGEFILRDSRGRAALQYLTSSTTTNVQSEESIAASMIIALVIIYCSSGIAYVLMTALGVWWVGRIGLGYGNYLLALIAVLVGMVSIGLLMLWIRTSNYLILGTMPAIFATFIYNRRMLRVQQTEGATRLPDSQ
jgi:hypothetical protein